MIQKGNMLRDIQGYDASYFYFYFAILLRLQKPILSIMRITLRNQIHDLLDLLVLNAQY